MAEWARAMAIAANAWPIELGKRLTAAEAAEVEGYQGEQWDSLREAMLGGGELHHFSSVRGAWSARCGRAGISLIRDGSPVCSVVTMVS